MLLCERITENLSMLQQSCVCKSLVVVQVAQQNIIIRPPPKKKSLNTPPETKVKLPGIVDIKRKKERKIPAHE